LQLKVANAIAAINNTRLMVLVFINDWRKLLANKFPAIETEEKRISSYWKKCAAITSI